MTNSTNIDGPRHSREELLECLLLLFPLFLSVLLDLGELSSDGLVIRYKTTSFDQVFLRVIPFFQYTTSKSAAVKGFGCNEQAGIEMLIERQRRVKITSISRVQLKLVQRSRGVGNRNVRLAG